MTAFYNEPDKFKAAVLRNLIEEGAIAHGIVDERPIQQVQAADVRGFTQCHWFAGGGVWSYALRVAGWPDDQPVWTGSCPCGPFSKAGKKGGFDDPRHLWPEWFRLIGECRPDHIFGEQSDEADTWLDLVSSDLEGCGYAIGSAIIPAAGFGGYHARHRIGFVADANNAEWWSDRAPWHDGHWPKTGRIKSDRHPGYDRADDGLADANIYGRQPGDGRRSVRPERHVEYGGELDWFGHSDRQSGLQGGSNPGGSYPRGDAKAWPGFGRDGLSFRMVHAHGARSEDAKFGIIRRPAEPGWPRNAVEQPGDSRRPGLDWLFCRDGAWRPVEPGACPLVDEAAARMGRLRLYGDAIDAETFANFIGAYLDAAPAHVIT